MMREKFLACLSRLLELVRAFSSTERPLVTRLNFYKMDEKVEFVCVSFNKVPHLNDSELEAIKDDGRALGGKVFTTEYKSAIAKTRAYEVTDEAKRYEILKILSQKYTAYAMSTFEVAAKYGLKIIKIYELKIESLSAKAKIIHT